MSISNGESALFEAITAANEFNDICGDNYATRFKVNKHNLEFALSCAATNSYVYRRITHYYRRPESLAKLTANVQEFKDAMTKAIERQKVKDKWDPRLQAKRDVKSLGEVS